MMKFNEILDNIEELKKKITKLKEESNKYIQKNFNKDSLEYKSAKINEKIDKYINDDNIDFRFNIIGFPRHINSLYNTHDRRQLRMSPYCNYDRDDDDMFYSIIESIENNCDIMAESFKIVHEMPVTVGDVVYTREGIILTFTEDKGYFDIINKYMVYWSNGKVKIDFSMILKIYNESLELESELNDGISVKTNITVISDYGMLCNEPTIDEEYTITKEDVERTDVCNTMLSMYKKLKPVVEKESVVLKIIGRGDNNG